MFGKLKEDTPAQDFEDNYGESTSERTEKAKRKYLLLGELLEETVSTRGWKEVIQPFLEKMGNPEIILQLHRKNPEDAARRAPGVDAFHVFHKYVNSLVRFWRKHCEDNRIRVDRGGNIPESEPPELDDDPLSSQ